MPWRRAGLGGGGSLVNAAYWPLSWLGFGRRSAPISLELHLHQIDPNKSNRLYLQAVFQPNSIGQLNDPVWRERCTDLFIELRAYLMGTSDAIAVN